jgi:hypothetical protein
MHGRRLCIEDTRAKQANAYAQGLTLASYLAAVPESP